ncbi:MAG: NusG domain II-containing protein, partial [Bacteroidia bacterium]|nr:NusG domain II-containing protein [Bacteroidia bacterium]
GKVRIAEETSPHNYCSIQGWVDDSGMPIICAPNYFMVIIEERL